MTKRYCLIDEELLYSRLEADASTRNIIQAITHHLRMSIKPDLFVEHDTSDDSYTIHNHAGMEDFLAEQREKGRLENK